MGVKMGDVQCGGCGGDNRTGAAFCQTCGEPLGVRTCPSCGVVAGSEARFCDACGAVLAAPSRSIVEHVAAPAAERRLVTVLFADAKGSTELTERIGDEAMYALVQECVTRMQRVVDAHDGTVAQFRGDGIMALFGAPVAVEDAAVRAVHAALEIQASLTAYGREVAARMGAACPFRVGVNTGPVVVGRIGEETLVDYTAIGDTANVAARLEQAAGPDEVFISDATWRFVRDFVECEDVGAVEVKGKRDGIRAHRALRRRLARSRLDAAEVRGLSPFVARDEEMALLQGFVSRLPEAGGRVVAIAGEAGIGKSRLLRELRERLPDGVEWFEGRSSAADRRAPWHLVVDLLRRSFGVAEHHTADDVAALVADRASGWSPPAQRAQPYVEWLLGLPAPSLDPLDPQERRAGIFEALVDVLRDAAGRRPLVVAFEDLHWADEASAAAVTALANAVADVPVLLVITYRPESAPELGDRPWFTRLALDGLRPDAAADLAAASVGTDLSSSARVLIADRSGGNPLFIEELIASLVEEGAAVPLDGVIELTGDPDELAVPASLQDVVLARISRLEREAREALQLAAVIGREFTRRILDRIAQMPDRLDTHLAELESLELIRQHSWFPELAYLFKHAVVHDVTYSTLLDERRKALHRIVALATEELYADALAEHCESLARHWLAAGDEERALPHLIEAGNRAGAGFSVARALDAHEHAASIAEDLGRLDTAIDLRITRLDGLLVTNDLAGIAAEVEQVIDLSARSDDVAAHAYALASQAFAEWMAHDFDAASASARRARELAATAPPTPRAADAFHVGVAVAAHVAAVLGRVDDFPRWLAELESTALAASPARRAITAAGLDMWANWRGLWQLELPSTALEGDARLYDRLAIQGIHASHAAGLGSYRLALDRLHEALALCGRTGELFGRARWLNSVGWIHGELGDTAGAVPWNEQSIVTIAPLGLPDREVEANARLNLADDALRDGRLDDVARELAELEPTIRRPSPTERWMLWRYSQRWFCISGELALVGDDAAAALSFADECLALAEKTESRKYIVRARRLRARALGALGRRGDAAADLSAALDLARQIGNPPQLWRTLVAAAELAGASGRPHAEEALAVIDRVVVDLGDHPLARTLAAGTERAHASSLCAV